jgi:hypothetical protein
MYCVRMITNNHRLVRCKKRRARKEAKPELKICTPLKWGRGGYCKVRERAGPKKTAKIIIIIIVIMSVVYRESTRMEIT